MFKYFNPNPKYNGRPHGWKPIDCSVRSICAATDLSWVHVYRLLTDIGLEEYTMPHDAIVYRKAIESLGFKSIKRCKKGEFTVKDIALLSKKTNCVYLCRTPNHFVCCRNGLILDTFDSSEKEVLQFWSRNLTNV